jgi:hypothetical protein
VRFRVRLIDPVVTPPGGTQGSRIHLIYVVVKRSILRTGSLVVKRMS